MKPDVETTGPEPPSFPRSVRTFGAIVAILGTMAIVGWGTKQPVLLSLRANYIPMAPNTALGFVLLGSGLIAFASGGRRLAGAAAVVVWGIAAIRLAEFTTGIDLSVDRMFLKVDIEQSGLAPVGKMALFTAVGFLAASVSLGLRALGGRWWVAGDVGGGAALVVGGTGMVFSLGYLFNPNAPLMYGTHVIPMALNTALGFIALGAGLVAVAGPSCFPLRRLSGPSTRARLLRVFLPLVMMTVVLVAWLAHLIGRSAGASAATLATAVLATAAIPLFGFLCERIAGRVGEALERAERELQRANERLERTVEERTAELSCAFRELQETHGALQAAHRELMDAQARMLQQAKMASLGQTAAGVAHEINNPLAFVTNNIAVLKREVAGINAIVRLYQEAEATLEEYQRDLLARIHILAEEMDLPYVLGNLDGLLDRSREGLKRIQKIVSDLRDFAHLDEADEAETDLNAGVTATVGLMRGVAAARGVTLATDLRAIPTLWCSGAKLNLVVQNLVSNAIDACSSGGMILVSTRPDRGGVRIEVRDDGTGIDPAIRDRIFDPFFTTKPIGKGTGLGLAMSFGIVRDHGGEIEVESTPGAGSRFAIVLPPSPGRWSAEKSATSIPSIPSIPR